MFRLLALAVLVSPALAGVHAPVADRSVAGTSPALAGVHPNPVTDGDAGEYVLLDAPPETNLSAYSLSDDDATVSLPNVTVSGRVALTSDPAAARNITRVRVVALPGSLALANGGENLTLSRNDAAVSTLSYEDAPEGEVRRSGTWRPLGATDFPPVGASDVPVRAFVLPDGASAVRDALRNARDRLLVGGYTFSSWRVARILRAAEERGVRTRVLVDGGPVGGVGSREARVLDALADAGVAVRVLDGERARYAFHHAKYAVADDRALVTSENWKPGGTGGHATRGWGVVVRDDSVADHLAAVHRADSTWRDATPWRTYRKNESFGNATPARGTYPQRFPGWNGTADARVLLTPDNARSGILDVVRSASDRLLVQQVRIDDDRFLNATIDAARRGVRTRVLLSTAWYVREENRRLVERLRETARDEGLDLRARLVDPRSRFGHLHVKGVVADDRAVVGSLNWNRESVTENREVMVVLDGAGAADYYAGVFRSDWRGGVWRLPLPALVVVLAVLPVTGVVLYRRVSFSGSVPTGVRRRVPRPPSSR